VPQGNPVALAVVVLEVAARLNVVLTHEADDVDDLNGQVARL
jgi:regulator of sirC expression with transglutaminase-like and TPR domain